MRSKQGSEESLKKEWSNVASRAIIKSSCRQKECEKVWMLWAGKGGIANQARKKSEWYQLQSSNTQWKTSFSANMCSCRSKRCAPFLNRFFLGMKRRPPPVLFIRHHLTPLALKTENHFSFFIDVFVLADTLACGNYIGGKPYRG